MYRRATYGRWSALRRSWRRRWLLVYAVADLFLIPRVIAGSGTVHDRPSVRVVWSEREAGGPGYRLKPQGANRFTLALREGTRLRLLVDPQGLAEGSLTCRDDSGNPYTPPLLEWPWYLETRRTETWHCTAEAKLPVELRIKVQAVADARRFETCRSLQERFSRAVEIWQSSWEEARRREALELAQQTLTQAGACDDAQLTASLYYFLGTTQSILGKKQEALAAFQKELALREGQANPALLGRAQNEVARHLRFLGRTDEAVETFHAALVSFERAADPAGRAAVLHNLGVTAYYRGELETAERHYAESLRWKEAAGDLAGAAVTYLNLGTVRLVLGYPEQALHYYQRAYDIRRELGDEAGRASVASSLATLHAAAGRYEESLRLLYEALGILEKSGEQERLAYTLHNLAYVYKEMGEFELALPLYARALEIRRQLGDTARVGTTLYKLAQGWMEEGQLPVAQQYLQEAVAAKRSAGDRYGLAYVLVGLAELKHRQGELSEAIQLAAESLALRRDLGHRAGLAASYLQLGSLFHSAGAGFRARELLLQALATARQLGIRPLEAKSLLALSRLERSEGHRRAARERAEEALAILQQIRETLRDTENRRAYLENSREVIEHLVELFRDAHAVTKDSRYQAAAWRAVEMYRARTLLETIGVTSFPLSESTAAAFPALAGELRRLDASIAALDKQRTWRLNRGETEKAAALEQLLAQDLARRRALRSRLTANLSPGFAGELPPISVVAVQDQLLQAGDVFVEYLLGAERSWAWVIDTRGIAGYELPSLAQLQPLLERWRLVLENPRSSLQAVAACAGELGRILLAGPAQRSPQPPKRLLVVADGPLHLVPFSALPWPTPAGTGADPQTTERRFSNAARIVRLPSAGVALKLRRLPREARPPRQDLLLVAAPLDEQNPTLSDKAGFSAAAVVRTTAPNRSLGFSALPGVRREIAMLESMLPPPRLHPLVGEAASRENLRKMRPSDFRVVHFATHAVTASRFPELSALVLPGAKGEPEELLWARELAQMSWPVPLVVLSGCQTAYARVLRGEGGLGLATAFLQAGARGVVASLWDVPDHATARFMQLFYQAYLQRKLSAPAALEEARRQMRQSWRFRHPHYWSAWVYFGTTTAGKD